MQYAYNDMKRPEKWFKKCQMCACVCVCARLRVFVRACVRVCVPEVEKMILHFFQ